MKAIRITAKGASAITDKDIPELRDGSLLVRVVCVALNPCDAKNLYHAGPAETLLGTDYSGVVEKTGQGYRKQWKVGDRIFGFVMGANAAHPTDGAFAEYVLVKADVQYRIPDHMSFEQAASLGVSLSTAAMGICHKLHMPIVLDEDPEDGDGAAQNVFIYGGSTATGTMSIQLARIAGYIPYTTCSPSNFDLVMSFGAEAAFDYHDLHCATKLSGAAGSRFSRAFDTISSNQSAQMCADVLKEGSEAAYTSTLPLADRFPSRKVIPKLLLLWSALGEAVHFMGHFMPAVPEDFTFLREFTETAEILLQDGDIRPHPVKVMQGGLEGIVAGLQELYDGRVSGEKLVYNIAAA